MHEATVRADIFHASGYGIIRRIGDQTIQDHHALPEVPECRPAATTLPSGVPAVSVEQRPTDYYGTEHGR